MSTHRICLWSGPRNVSTALMYSFRQRPDTTVVDEPLYAAYLARSGADHPGREEVLADQSSDPEVVIEDVILGQYPTPVVFFKQMAHHLEGIDWAFLKRVDHILLTRDPRDMLRSLTIQLPDVDLDGTGLPQQVALLAELERLGAPPLVIVSHRLLSDPPAVLRAVCEALGLAWDPAMLSWPAGPKPEDGVWAKHWYEAVHRSTAFDPYRAKTEPFPSRLEPLLQKCQPLYARLLEQAIG